MNIIRGNCQGGVNTEALERSTLGCVTATESVFFAISITFGYVCITYLEVSDGMGDFLCSWYFWCE